MKKIAKIAAISATASALCVGCNKDENPAHISSDFSGLKGNFKSALISQWGHSEVITQCFSNHGF